jgi:hypothetical protein
MTSPDFERQARERWLAEVLGVEYPPKKDTSHLAENDEDLLNGDVVKLSREGYCHLAAVLLFEELGVGHPCVILNEGKPNSYAHYFLEINGKALDLGGVYTFEEILGNWPKDGPIEKTSWKNVKADRSGSGMSEKEWEILPDRFGEHIRKHKKAWLVQLGVKQGEAN